MYATDSGSQAAYNNPNNPDALSGWALITMATK